MSDQPKILPLGVHASIAGGIEKSLSRAEQLNCRALQIFTRNASRWQSKPLSPQSIADFRKAAAQSPIEQIFVHDSYLINLAAPDEEKWQKSKAAFLDELERCSVLGIKGLVMHPGAHLGEGEEDGLQRIASAFREIFRSAPRDVQVLLETTAGMGSHLGWKFEHLARIIELVPEHDFGVCFDTCHVFAAGYDLSDRTGYQKTMTEFERLVGCNRIRLFHMNDSKKPCASRVDRHEHIGQGHIGEVGFACLMQDGRFTGVAKILETPQGDEHEHDLRNLALLRRLAGEAE